eukprot:gene8534-11414_t
MLRLFTKRCLTTTVALRANKPPVLDWMQQAELDAAKASKGRKLQESGSEFWKRAVAARQELIAQREAAGLVKDSQANSETIHLLFPIPAAM